MDPTVNLVPKLIGDQGELYTTTGETISVMLKV